MKLLDIGAVRVGLGLVVGLALIFYFNPPHTACQSQIDLYHEGLSKLGGSFKKFIGICREHPEPGGCVEIFETVGRIDGKLAEVTPQCQKNLADDDATKQWVTTSMDLLVRLAWGSTPPQSSLYRNGWLDLNQVVLFCKLRKHLEAFWGADAWTDFGAATLADLPGSEALQERTGRGEAWGRSLMSDQCNYIF